MSTSRADVERAFIEFPLFRRRGRTVADRLGISKRAKPGGWAVCDECDGIVRLNAVARLTAVTGN